MSRNYVTFQARIETVSYFLLRKLEVWGKFAWTIVRHGREAAMNCCWISHLIPFFKRLGGSINPVLGLATKPIDVDAGFRDAVSDFLDRERRAVERDIRILEGFGPFRKADQSRIPIV